MIRMIKMIIMITRIATIWANARLRWEEARGRVRKANRLVRAVEILPRILVNAPACEAEEI